MAKLRWEPLDRAGSWEAKCGNGSVATVLRRDDGCFKWRITAVQMHEIDPGRRYGEASRAHVAKKAVERNWRRWLEHYGFVAHV